VDSVSFRGTRVTNQVLTAFYCKANPRLVGCCGLGGWRTAILTCEKCGAEIPEGTSYCAQCGTPVSVAQLGSVSVPRSASAAEEAIRPPEAAPARPERLLFAGFWLRLAAFAIDTLLMVAPLLLIGALFPGRFAKVFPPVTSLTDFPQPSPAVLLSLALVGCLYYTLFEASPWQATPGKKILRLYVADLSGRRVSFGRALLRNLARQLSGIFFVGYIMAGFTEKKQALHDILSSCLVLRRP
jgi:uncharacterized RDD family membrane protein YckC